MCKEAHNAVGGACGYVSDTLVSMCKEAHNVVGGAVDIHISSHPFFFLGKYYIFIFYLLVFVR